MKSHCKKIFLGLFFIVLMLFHLDTAMAALLTPTGLNGGDQYHLIFMTSGVRDATSTNINDYDAFVQNAATLAGLGSITWKALASTETVSAKDHTDISAPVYSMIDTLTATGYSDIWDGTIISPVNYDEYGNEVTTSYVWTGTTAQGDINTGGPDGGGGKYLGHSNPRMGWRAVTNSYWIEDGDAYWTLEMHLYGISEVLTVSPVPIPGAIWLLSSGLIGLVGFRRKFKKV